MSLTRDALLAALDRLAGWKQNRERKLCFGDENRRQNDRDIAEIAVAEEILHCIVRAMP